MEAGAGEGDEEDGHTQEREEGRVDNGGPCDHCQRNLPRRGGSEQLLIRNVERFRGGLVFKAHRLLYHSTLGSRVVTKRRRRESVRRLNLLCYLRRKVSVRE